MVDNALPAARVTLTAYRLRDAVHMPLVPAAGSRSWMTKTNRRFAYRCLPMVIANQAGWFILTSHELTVTWNGLSAPDGLTIEYSGGSDPYTALSHCGHGILTWQIPYLFRTSPGYNLLARGPANCPKVGAYPLEELVETDWSVATFTMNWQLTMPGSPVKFSKGEPICMVVPQRRGELESVETRLCDIEEEPEISRQYLMWQESRERNYRDLTVPGSSAQKLVWQKQYLQGDSPGGAQAPEHQTSLKLRPFIEES